MAGDRCIPGTLSFCVDACDTTGAATVVVDTKMVGVLMLTLAIDTLLAEFEEAAEWLAFEEAEPMLMLINEAAAADCCKCSSAAAAAFDCCCLSSFCRTPVGVALYVIVVMAVKGF